MRGTETCEVLHGIEREYIRLGLLEEVEKGLADIKADRTIGAAEARAKYGRSVTSSTKRKNQPPDDSSR